MRLSGVFDSAPPVLEIAALVLLAGALWLATHPYVGIYHDAIIYSLLAARWIDPSSYANDVFFLFGSQDDVNLFAPLFGELVSLVGLDLANRLVALLGGGLWVGANALLAYRVFGLSLPFRFVVLATAASSLSYSPNGFTFALNENFATARVIAMPLVVLGIWADLCRLRFLALGAQIAALLIHPLIGIWGVLAFICIRLPVSVLLLGACCALGLVAANDIWPLSSHLAPMSFEWIEAVRNSSVDVLFGDLASVNVGRFLWWIGVLWLGARLGNGMLRRYYLVLALMTACACLLTLYCSYYNPIELFVQIQPWRVLWLAIALGWLALADASWQVIRLGRVGWFGLGFFLIAAYLAGSHAWAIPIVLAIGLSNRLVVPLATRVAKLRVDNKKRCLYVLAGATLILLPSYLVDIEMLGLTIPGNTFGSQHFLRGWLLGGGLGLGFVSLAWLGGYRLGSFVILALAVPSLIFSAINWDQRPAHLRLSESRFLSHSGEVHPFAQFVAPGDTIAWPAHELEVWFALHASNYACSTQAVGIVFSESKTREITARLERMAATSTLATDDSPLDSPDAAARFPAVPLGPGVSGNLHRYAPSRLSLEGGRHLCEDTRLRWFVASHQTTDGDEMQVVQRYSDRHGSYGLYSCNSFR